MSLGRHSASDLARAVALALAGLAAVAAVAACASKPKPPPGPVLLEFFDSKLFDDQLRRAMAEESPEITVAFIGTDATVNEIPDRLDRWLTTIASEDAQRVQVRPDPRLPMPKNPAAIGLGLSLAMRAYDATRDWLFFAVAGDYDAVLLHDPRTGRLTRLVFARRPQE